MPVPQDQGGAEWRAVRQSAVQKLRGFMPQAMRERSQWLLWKLEDVPGRNGLQKVPYYVDGGKRAGELGGEKDLKRLAGFDRVLDRFSTMRDAAGVGFAFIKGDGLIGIDLDDVFDADGVMPDRFVNILEACPSFTERSPSGTGLHIIVAGQCDSFKHDPVGVEVYCGDRFFCCTGDRYGDTPAEVQPIKPFALAYLQQIVQASKDKARAEKLAAQRGAAAPAAEPVGETLWRPMVRHEAAGQRGDDFKRVNQAAYERLAAWVPQVFPYARPWQDGYRVRSKDMGRDLEEDLQLTPKGVYDFGEEQGMSPIDVVMKWAPGAPTPKAAMLWLASALGLQVAQRPRLRAVEGGRSSRSVGPAPAPEDDEGYSEGPPPPPDEEHDAAPPEGEGGDAPPPKRPRGRGKAGANGAQGGGGGGIVERLLKHYALVRGTDQVWDGEMRATMAVKNLRLLYGSPFVALWLGHPKRRLLLPEHIKFEPGQDLPEPCVNLFDGLPVEPVECSEEACAPMLDLLRHLTSLSAPTPEGVRDVYLQVLRWCALIVQKPGAKIRFALVFHGPQGTGKNLFWDGFRRILGKYGKMVGQTELEDRFNGYMSGKLLLIGNEVVTRQELFHNKNKLKWVITEDEIPIRGMHQEVRWESNHANVVFLSNELQPVALEKDDRRHLVVYTPAAEDPALYQRVADFLASDGPGKFLYYLLNFVDLGDFTEFTKPLMTQAKAELIDLGLKPAERFANEWLGGFLDLPLQPCSNEQLYRVFTRWCDSNGERFKPPQAQFTRTVERHVFELAERDPETGKKLPPRLAYKQISLKHEVGPRKTVRCWVPRGTGPVNGVTEGEWAAQCIESFEKEARAFGRSHHFGDGHGPEGEG